MREVNEIEIQESSGNVFEDLGFEDAPNMMVRATLAMSIREFVSSNKLSQQEAARIMRTTQPRLNDVLRGRLSKVTTDRLIVMLHHANLKVTITVHNAASNCEQDQSEGPAKLARVAR